MPSTGKNSAVASRAAASGGEELREGLGVQEWHDGSRYEGVFVSGLKHGNGKYTWASGEHYEGSFYKDYRHGGGIYSWPSGHKFTGKFYLNRREGYGHLLFPDGSTFQGLYNCDLRFGPGVMKYPDGRSDVGFWVGECLLKLCAPVEEGFSLRQFPEYAAYVGSFTQLPISDLQIDPTVETNPDLPSDETFILPCGIESYSTDGDHLPLPPGRRRELDQHFFGELWEPDARLHQGYERDPLSSLPLEARLQAHIHKHRLQAEALDWDVGAVLSLNRGSFGPKGPLEVTSELLIHNASIGDLQAVSQILLAGVVHPDVADSHGHTALIAATINCHIDTIHLLLDVGVDIDRLNCEGMSALAVCHVLHYHLQSQHDTITEPAAVNQVFESPTFSQGDLSIETPRRRPETVNTILDSQTNHSHLPDETELTEPIEQQPSSASIDSELTAKHKPRCWEPRNPSESEEKGEEMEIGGRLGEWKKTAGWAGQRNQDFWENDGVSRGKDETNGSGSDQSGGNEESDGIEEDNIELSGIRETESGKERMEPREKDEEEEQETGSACVERSIQVLDGDMALGSVQWRDRRAETAGRIQQSKDEELNSGPTFDSACSLKSFSIHVTEEVMQCSAEVLSRAGFRQSSDTNETVRKMAAMKTEHRLRLDTLKLLLERGADPNISRVPMPVIFLAIIAADVEAVRRLLLCGARTDIPLPPEAGRQGLYPLHVAASLTGPAGPIITELLLHAVTDPDARACDQDEVYEPDKVLMKPQDLQDTAVNLSPKEGGRTALHMACMRESDHRNASKVVALLLSHSASTDLLWSGHSPLSLAIATGNERAVEELLNGGADPNIPLGQRVGSALCALTNFHYRLCGNRAKLLDMLAKAGADCTMPIKVNGAMGTAVDSAYHSFNQDLRIAKTPFHALNMRERETFKERSQLLSIMGNLLRQTAVQREQENLERARQRTQSRGDNHTLTAGAISSELPSCQLSAAEEHRSPVSKFCYHCGRSAYVKLTSCSRCGRVFYCSRSCRLKGWDERHKHECSRSTASADVVRKRLIFKSQRAFGTLSATLSSKAFPNALNIEEDFLYELNLKENYSFN
ncbi:ankyrin repeat and MYND domain-containing protein 1-like [Nelusetta ayraudi]|uniref:ankyrin repeat and MYND domain-containing protein 1-like n=1 Tax=Nelusetta ayraudi TaxID=303726 RepID=UPI003F6F0410